MSTITTAGIGSGLDINGIVRQLVQAEGQPTFNRLNRQEARVTTELSALGSFRSTVSSLQSAVKALTSKDLFTGIRASVSDSTLVSASADKTAALGSYQIEVKSLAQSQTLASTSVASNTAAFGGGKLTISLGTYDADANTFTQKSGTSDVEIDIAADSSLDAIRDAINEKKMGVTASVVNDGSGYRLALRSDRTGAENGIKIAVDDNDGDGTDANGLSRLAFDPTAVVGSGKNLTQTRAATDSEVLIDGLSVKRPNTTVENAIPGVTLTVKKAEVGKLSTVTVARDTASVSGAVDGFVKAYNELVTQAKSLTSYNAQTGEAGALIGNSLVRGVSSQLNNLLGQALGGAGDIDRLTDIGISVQRDGTLQFKSGELTKAIEADPEAVQNLFTRDASGGNKAGFAKQLDDYATKLLDREGPFKSRTDSLNRTIGRINEQRESVNTRLAKYEERLQNQFIAMDKLVANLNATGNSLNQFFTSLNNAGNQR